MVTPDGFTLDPEITLPQNATSVTVGVWKRWLPGCEATGLRD